MQIYVYAYVYVRGARAIQEALIYASNKEAVWIWGMFLDTWLNMQMWILNACICACREPELLKRHSYMWVLISKMLLKIWVYVYMWAYKQMHKCIYIHINTHVYML
jgi:hypothetical protein